MGSTAEYFVESNGGKEAERDARYAKACREARRQASARAFPAPPAFRPRHVQPGA